MLQNAKLDVIRHCLVAITVSARVDSAKATDYDSHGQTKEGTDDVKCPSMNLLRSTSLEAFTRP